jgi:hypothetical protein
MPMASTPVTAIMSHLNRKRSRNEEAVEKVSAMEPA